MSNNKLMKHVCFFSFSKGKALTQLDLSQNSLSSVPTPALKSLDRLLIFNLNHNKISAIHANAFDGMSTLEILTLYENRLTNIEPNAFAGTEKYIPKRVIHKDTNRQYYNVLISVHRKLKRLNIGGNELNRVPTEALQTMDNLKKLEIQENKITAINDGDFIGRLKYNC